MTATIHRSQARSSSASAPQRTVAGLGELRSEDTALFGAKAVRLGLAAGKGLRVPPGFCISREAFDRHLASCGSNSIDLIACGDYAALRSAVLDHPLDPALDESIRIVAAQHIPPGSAVAVRSSSTAEDLEGSSSAGVYRSELRVSLTDELSLALRRCWAAYWSDEAVSYRESVGLRHEDHGMGILVQVMLEPRFAGVAFTQDPVSEACDDVLVEVVEGVGETLVDGSSQPRLFRFERPLDQSERKAGHDGAAAAAAQLALKCEDLAGRPQDVEWAADNGGELHLLQTRPVVSSAATSGGPKPSAAGWQLVYEEPFSPLGCELAEKRFLKWCEAISRYYRVAVSPRIRTEDGLISYEPLWRRPGGLLRLGKRLMTALRCLQAGSIHDRYTQTDLPRTISELEDLARETERASDPQELLDCLDRSIASYLEQQLNSFAIGKVAAAEGAVLDILCRRWLPSSCSVSALDLLSGLANASSERELALDRLRLRLKDASSQRINDWDDLERVLETSPRGAVLRQELHDFEQTYGYVWADRYPRDPAWQVDRQAEVETLSMRSAGEAFGGDLEAGVGRTRKRREESIALCRSALGRSWRRWVFDAVLRRAERDFPHREGRNEIVYRGVCVIRASLRSLGRHLSNRSVLSSPDDVFFLQLDELRERIAAGGQDRSTAELVADRKSRYERTLDSCRRLGVLDNAAETAPDASTFRLDGDACSPGLATGPARVISGLGEFSRVRPGDIVVCRQLRPAWTALFSRIAGAAIELGGVLSHGSILAREYGVPVVINVPRLCELVKDGDWITLDGRKGILRIERSLNSDGDQKKPRQVGAARG